MSTKITSKQAKSRLLKAIDRAENFKGCQYLNEDNSPCCVIGQLAFMEKIPVEEIKSWGGCTVHHAKVAESELCMKYALRLLTRLQSIWDGKEPWSSIAVKTENDARAMMEAEVEEYFKVNP